MKRLICLVGTFIVIFVASAAVAQSLAEIAKKEAQQARRDRRLFTGLGVFEEEN